MSIELILIHVGFIVACAAGSFMLGHRTGFSAGVKAVIDVNFEKHFAESVETVRNESEETKS